MYFAVVSVNTIHSVTFLIMIIISFMVLFKYVFLMKDENALLVNCFM